MASPTSPSSPLHAAARELTGRFRLPDDGAAERFAAAQIQVHREAPELYPYLYGIQNHVEHGTEPSPDLLAASSHPMADRIGSMLCSASSYLPRRSYDADVLLCGVWKWERETEIRLLQDLLTGLLESGRSVLCVVATRTASSRRLREAAAQVPSAPAVHFLDPRRVPGRLADRLDLDVVHARTDAVLRQLLDVLRPAGLTLAPGAREEVAWTAACEAYWRPWAPALTFDAAVVRCHWLPMCSSIVQTAQRRDIPVSTLQQGVISHTIDVPVHADRYVCFGDASSRALQDLDHSIRQHADLPARSATYAAAGSLFDPISEFSPAREARTILVIGQFTDWAVSYYGIADERSALFSLLDRLAHRRDAVARIVVRPHPARGGEWADWQALQDRHPNMVEISSPYTTTIDDDVEEASAVLGMFSGALATAAACGRPVFFLTCPGGYRCPDLAPFTAQTGSAGTLEDRLCECLRSDSAYEAERAASLQAARDYYRDGAQAEIDAAFVNDVLMPGSHLPNPTAHR